MTFQFKKTPGAPRSAFRYFFDAVNADYIEGWAYSPTGLEAIEVRVDGILVGVTAPVLPRPDVQAAIPAAPANTGFRFHLSDTHLRSKESTVTVVFRQVRGEAIASDPVIIPHVTENSLGRGSTTPAPVPLPLPIYSLLCDLRGGQVYSAPWTDELLHEAIDDLAFVARRGTKRLPSLYHYLGFLRTIWAKFEFVLQHFPKFNANSRSQKDSIAIASSVEEMFSIAHYLYVLKSQGKTGHFAEFGCFKGFSTSMLSEACFQLGIPMEVFDSFAGLPTSASAYYQAGEFMGSLAEVRRNVSAFGKIEAVTFHAGYFGDTLPQTDITLLCLWMDVDLESSSRDVMSILGKLPIGSCLFSHECNPEYFKEGRVEAPRGTDSVIGPIVDAFTEQGRHITGRFLFGNTGAFWDLRYGTPVLPVRELLRIKDLAVS